LEIDRLQSSLTRKERELQERERNVDAAVQERVAVEAARIEKEAQEKARGSLSVGNTGPEKSTRRDRNAAGHSAEG